MQCYLCKHCKALTNVPVTAACEDSPSREHEWVSGDMVADQVQMLWEREPDSLASASN